MKRLGHTLYGDHVAHGSGKFNDPAPAPDGPNRRQPTIRRGSRAGNAPVRSGQALLSPSAARLSGSPGASTNTSTARSGSMWLVLMNPIT